MIFVLQIFIPRIIEFKNIKLIFLSVISLKFDILEVVDNNKYGNLKFKIKKDNYDRKYI